MTIPYLIRPATLADAPGIARVHVDTWRTTYVGIVPDDHLVKLSYERSQARWLEHLAEHPEQAAFVAVDQGGRVIGFASCGPNREAPGEIDGELYGLYLLKVFQGQGIGKALVLRAVQHLQEQGFHSMIIWCLQENPTCGFYERLGGRLSTEKTIEIGGKTLVDVGYIWPKLILAG